MGEDILIAPVLTEKATKRDIVLPKGKWVDGNNGTVYEGNVILKDYPAPLDILPYFFREVPRSGSSQSIINIFVLLLLNIYLIIYY